MRKNLLLGLVLLLCSCNNPVTESIDDVIYESMILEENSIELSIGDIYQLKVSHTPLSLPAPECTYSISPAGIVSVDNNGLVLAIRAGTVTITVIPSAETNLPPCVCTVVVKPMLSERITLSETSLSLKTGATRQLTVEIFPSETSNKEVEWESSNTQIATVVNGLVTAIAPGIATIRVKTKDNSSSAECILTVSPPSVESVMIVGTVPKFMIGETFQLQAVVSPENAGNKNVTWSIANNSIASVSSSGLVTALSIGETTITVTTVDGGFTATVPVVVADITDFILAFRGSSAITSISGWVTGSVGSTISNRHTTIAVTVTKFEVIDNKTNQIIATKIDELGILAPEGTMSLSYRLVNVLNPDLTFKWYYTSDGREYSVSHVYQ